MKKVCIVVPADATHDLFFTQFENSLRKFHSEEELPLLRVKGDPSDPFFWYRAAPLVIEPLLNDYETVIKCDADQIVTGNLSDIWTDTDYDVAVVLNDPNFQIRLWDIEPYFNNGLVAVRSMKFVKHWKRLCMSRHFNSYQFKEQDLLNVLCSDYHDYKVKCLDNGKLYGEVAKPVWPQVKIEDGKFMVQGKELCVIHFGGGNVPDKGNYRIRFQPEVVKKIEELINVKQ